MIIWVIGGRLCWEVVDGYIVPHCKIHCLLLVSTSHVKRHCFIELALLLEIRC